MLGGKKILAPIITVFDSRGCKRENTEYTGCKRFGDLFRSELGHSRI